jgi:ABC-type cobalamin/Fe3+-siderophores transport system ATPase subunit
VKARLEARDAVVRRGGREVLHGVSLSIGEGDAVALVGPNAAGKSTLVRALAGLLRPERGEILLEGRDVAAWDRDARARTLALVTPEDEAPPSLTVEDRVALGRYPHRGPFRPLTGEDQAAVQAALAQTGIQALARRALETLSAGERQLAALARGLAQQPRVLLLDEPGAHLDVGHQLGLFRVLDQARSGGMAVLAVVHDLAQAARWAGRMVLLDEGRVAAEGPPDAVLTSAEAARAFRVSVRAHALPGAAHRLYSFEEPP